MSDSPSSPSLAFVTLVRVHFCTLGVPILSIKWSLLPLRPLKSTQMVKDQTLTG